MSITSVRLKPEVEETLEALADEMDRSKSYIINQALDEYIQRQRLKELRWAQTLEALNSVEKGKIVDGDDVVSWIKSWGTEGELDKPKA